MLRRLPLILSPLLLLAGSVSAQNSAAPADIPPPTAQAWTALAALPDLSGVWSPDIADQSAQERNNPPPWTPAVQKQVAYWQAEERAGRPHGLFINCLPHGMPSQMTVAHNAMEFLVTPGRITLLGESDGNRLRRIWTDGRAMPDDPDPSFNGTSVGHWEGATLVVDTKAILPQVYLATSESIGIPLGEGATIREKIHLLDAGTMAVDLEVSAPAILTRPWTTRRLYHRHRARSYEIVEGVCRQGDFHEGKDQWGNATYEPTTQEQGNLLPPSAAAKP